VIPPTQDNWERTRKRRGDSTPLIYEGPQLSPTSTDEYSSHLGPTSGTNPRPESSSEAQYTNTGLESIDTDDGDQYRNNHETYPEAKVPPPDDTDIKESESVLRDTTQTALFTLGEQFTSLGVVTENPLVTLVQESYPVKFLTHQFWQEISLCGLVFNPPKAPPGADELERTHRQATCIEDAKARETALRRAMMTDEEYLTQLQVAETSYRGYVDTLHAPLSTSYVVGQVITKILRQFESTMVQLCRAMKTHVPVLGIDRQLQLQEESHSARTQLEQDLFSDIQSMAEARAPIRDVVAPHKRPQQHLVSLYDLMVHIIPQRPCCVQHGL
jgi:hypothetical protein